MVHGFKNSALIASVNISSKNSVSSGLLGFHPRMVDYQWKKGDHAKDRVAYSLTIAQMPEYSWCYPHITSGHPGSGQYIRKLLVSHHLPSPLNNGGGVPAGGWYGKPIPSYIVLVNLANWIYTGRANNVLNFPHQLYTYASNIIRLSQEFTIMLPLPHGLIMFLTWNITSEEHQLWQWWK